jgi:C4-dicarboxylate-specific signal transduction histidine kinase
VDLRVTLESCICMAWNEIRHRARLVRDFAATPLIEANEGRLAQVFLNLLLNAAQAIPEGHADDHQICVLTRTAGANVTIEISDTGTGIAPEHMGRLFEPFFTTKPIGVGTGLGLSVCHGIIKSLGGTIEAKSLPCARLARRVKYAHREWISAEGSRIMAAT